MHCLNKNDMLLAVKLSMQLRSFLVYIAPHAFVKVFIYLSYHCKVFNEIWYAAQTTMQRKKKTG